MSDTTAQDLKDLSKAHSYANWSVFGLIIPFVGLILAGMALSFLKVIPSNKDTELRIQQVKKTAFLGIVVSVIAMLFWGGFYKYNSWQNEKEQEVQSEQSEQDRKLQEGLLNCLGDADNTYNYMWESEEKRLGRTDNTLPFENIEMLDKQREDSKNDCYRQHEAGLIYIY